MKSVKIPGGGLCPKCRRPMQRKTHGAGWTPSPEASIYYKWWDTCTNRAHKPHVQHYAAARVELKDQRAPVRQTGDLFVPEHLDGPDIPPWEDFSCSQ